MNGFFEIDVDKSMNQNVLIIRGRVKLTLIIIIKIEIIFRKTFRRYCMAQVMIFAVYADSFKCNQIQGNNSPIHSN